MRGLILYNGYSDIPSYDHQISRIMEEFEALGVDMTSQTNNVFLAHIEDGVQKVEVDADFCIFLDKDRYASFMVESCGIRMFNSASSIAVCDDKMLTYMALSGHGISMPDSTAGPLFYDPSMPTDRDSCEVLENRYGYPMVVKECFGSSGKGVHLARDREGLVSILDSLRGRPYLVQRYVDTSVGEDLRVIVIGGKAIGSMLRHSDTDFRSNVALGGSSFNQDVSDVSRSVAEKVAEVLGLDYCGVDLLKDEGGQYSIVCEVNSNAFFESFEESTGINVAKAYALHIMQIMQKGAGSEEIIE